MKRLVIFVCLTIVCMCWLASAGFDIPSYSDYTPQMIQWIKMINQISTTGPKKDYIPKLKKALDEEYRNLAKDDQQLNMINVDLARQDYDMQKVYDLLKDVDKTKFDGQLWVYYLTSCQNKDFSISWDNLNITGSSFKQCIWTDNKLILKSAETMPILFYYLNSDIANKFTKFNNKEAIFSWVDMPSIWSDSSFADKIYFLYWKLWDQTYGDLSIPNFRYEPDFQVQRKFDFVNNKLLLNDSLKQLIQQVYGYNPKNNLELIEKANFLRNIWLHSFAFKIFNNNDKSFYPSAKISSYQSFILSVIFDKKSISCNEFQSNLQWDREKSQLLLFTSNSMLIKLISDYAKLIQPSEEFTSFYTCENQSVRSSIEINIKDITRNRTKQIRKEKKVLSILGLK